MEPGPFLVSMAFGSFGEISLFLDSPKTLVAAADCGTVTKLYEYVDQWVQSEDLIDVDLQTS